MLAAREHCPYRSADPVTGNALVICYRKAVPWFPLMWEGYYVYADRYDSGGQRVRREHVETVDIPIDVELQYSRMRWDAAKKAFVDNDGREIRELPPS